MSKKTGRLKGQLRIRDQQIDMLKRRLAKVEAERATAVRRVETQHVEIQSLKKQFDAIDHHNIMSDNDPAIVVRRCSRGGFRDSQQWTFQVFINEMELRYEIMSRGRERQDEFASSEHAYYFIAMAVEKGLRDLFRQMMDKMRGINSRPTFANAHPDTYIRDRR